MSGYSGEYLRVLQQLTTSWTRHRRIKLSFVIMILVNACLYLVIYSGRKEVVSGREVATSKPRDGAGLSTRDLGQVRCGGADVVKDVVRHHGANAEEHMDKLCRGTSKGATTAKSRGLFSWILGWFGAGNSTKARRSLSASHNYKLVLNQRDVCRTSSTNGTEVFLLVCVFTVHANFEKRKAIRETWGSQKLIKDKRIVTLFMLGKSSNAFHQKLVELESRRHGDILMEDFVDAYHNLTLKTIMTMKWASQYCPNAHYVMKTDDDMYVNYKMLITHLTDPGTPPTNYFVGSKFSGNAPIRNPKSKWYVPRKMYPNTKYPSFCSGTGYVMSGDVPGRAYNMSLRTRYLYLEDVYMGLCMKKLKINMTGHTGFHIDNQPYKYCAYKRLITTHGKTTTEMYRIWEDQRSRGNTRCIGVKS
ncbi:beta-1,3-galactosyltransferase 1-like [Diadema antillarum]|uniref:beta-1,3-galactosyltransferase 1-like n=1 Tax=Diadema antillarum TaxID=105358 RepID=UPI003A847CB8